MYSKTLKTENVYMPRLKWKSKTREKSENQMQTARRDTENPDAEAGV